MKKKIQINIIVSNSFIKRNKIVTGRQPLVPFLHEAAKNMPFIVNIPNYFI